MKMMLLYCSQHASWYELFALTTAATTASVLTFFAMLWFGLGTVKRLDAEK